VLTPSCACHNQPQAVLFELTPQFCSTDLGSTPISADVYWHMWKALYIYAFIFCRN